jgi:hypothetical protein
MKNFKNHFWAVVLIGTTLTSLLVMCTKRQVNDANTLDPATANLPNTTNSLPASPPFVHPGILNTTASLDLIRAQANAGTNNRNTDYTNTVIAYTNSHHMPTSYPSVVVTYNTDTSASALQFKSNAILAYAWALRWVKTGAAADADSAKAILNGWGHCTSVITHVGEPNPDQYQLMSAWAQPTYSAAAEIIRYYQPGGVGAGWASADINTFVSFINMLKNNSNKILTSTQYYASNWRVSAAYAKVTAGVFMDNRSVYQNGVDSLVRLLPQVILSDGTLPELCGRGDCGHFQFSLTGLTYGAEIARIQGDTTLYGSTGRRIKYGYDFMLTAYSQAVTCANGNTYACITPTTSQLEYGGVEMAYRYYQSPNMSTLRTFTNPTTHAAVGAPYRAQGGDIFLSFTTFTHYGVPL